MISSVPMRVTSNYTHGFWRASCLGFTALALILLILSPSLVEAQEDIAPFKLMDVSGNLDVRYHFYESRNQSPAGKAKIGHRGVGCI